MLKVAMFAAQFLPHIGGVEVHTHEVCMRLKDLYDITVVTATSGDMDLPYKVIRNYDIVDGDLSEYDILHFHDFSHFRVKPQRSYITFHGWEGQFPPLQEYVFRRLQTCKNVAGTMHIGAYQKKWYGTGHHNDVVVLGGCTEQDCLLHLDRKAGYIGRKDPDKKMHIYEEAITKYNSLYEPIEYIQGENIERNMVYSFWADKKYAMCNGYLAALEAMACGVPVIAVAANEMTRDGLLELAPAYVCDTSDQVVEALKFLETDPNAYKIASMKSHAFAKMNSWASVANAYIKLWEGK